MSAKVKLPKADSLWFPEGVGPLTGMSRIMGIDPSLSSTGVCLLRDGKLAWSKSLTPAKGLVGPARLHWLRAILDGLLGNLQPAAVVIEGYSYGSPNNREALAEWGGVLRLLLWERNIPTLVAAPQTLRKFILTEPGSGKDKTMLASFKRWGVEFATNDECDAHGLAQLGALRLDIEAGRFWPCTPARMSEAALKAEPLIKGDQRLVRKRSN